MLKMNGYFQLLFVKRAMDDIKSQGYRYDKVLEELASFENEFTKNGISEQELDIAFEGWIKDGK